METQPTPVQPEPKRYPATLIALVGISGSGKSTALRNLPWDKTALIDIERKGMPFRLKDATHFYQPKTLDEYYAALLKIEKDPTMQIVVIDSFSKLAQFWEVYSTSKAEGYQIWKMYANLIREGFIRLKNMGKCVIITGHEERESMQGLGGNEIPLRRMYVQGGWGKIGLESECIAVWFSGAKPEVDAAGKPTGKMFYYLNTQTTGGTTAKTPMFWGLQPQEPNDVNAMLETIMKNL